MRHIDFQFKDVTLFQPKVPPSYSLNLPLNCIEDIVAMSATVYPNVPQVAVCRPHARHATVRPVHLQAAPGLYQARHPEQSLLYRTIADHFETWLALASNGQFDGQGDMHTPAPYVETAFRKYLECGIFAYGFARCDACGQDFLVAFSCKGRGVCPSCNTRCMVETAAHLSDHIIPKLPVLKWVLKLPKRLRYFLQNDPKALNTALRIFLRVILASLQANLCIAYVTLWLVLRIETVAF